MSTHETFHGQETQAYTLISQLEDMGYKVSVPVDIEDMINFLEIKFEIKPDFKKIKVTGSIAVKDGEPYIWVNPMKNTSKERKRFTLAHELGHFMLHIAPLKDFNDFQAIEDENISFNRDDNWDYKEMEANNFAAQLLMPAQFVEKEFDQLLSTISKIKKDEVIIKLAGKFNVSKQAMEFRLKKLGVQI
ncbi:ImmA/IrrE family metallo-endopeptidase [Sulfurovum sp.]|uniref:ImmA/IrrE family metallo-endopeptidase n=1 Tax=Sulfurovum sp. TaxID=1969726 RepID=UPI003566B8E1